jgi:hypothetical protein
MLPKSPEGICRPVENLQINSVSARCVGHCWNRSHRVTLLVLDINDVKLTRLPHSYITKEKPHNSSLVTKAQCSAPEFGYEMPSDKYATKKRVTTTNR